MRKPSLLILLTITLGAALLAGCDNPFTDDSPTRPCLESRELHLDAVPGAPVGTFTIREEHDDVIVDGASRGTNGAFFVAPSTPPERHTVSYRIGTCFSVTVVFEL